MPSKKRKTAWEGCESRGSSKKGGEDGAETYTREKKKLDLVGADDGGNCPSFPSPPVQNIPPRNPSSFSFPQVRPEIEWG